MRGKGIEGSESSFFFSQREYEILSLFFLCNMPYRFSYIILPEGMQITIETDNTILLLRDSILLQLQIKSLYLDAISRENQKK
jgi:hypothetical protein